MTKNRALAAAASARLTNRYPSGARPIRPPSTLNSSGHTGVKNRGLQKFEVAWSKSNSITPNRAHSRTAESSTENQLRHAGPTRAATSNAAMSATSATCHRELSGVGRDDPSSGGNVTVPCTHVVVNAGLLRSIRNLENPRQSHRPARAGEIPFCFSPTWQAMSRLSVPASTSGRLMDWPELTPLDRTGELPVILISYPQHSQD